MKKTLITLAGALAVCMSAQVFAQDCAAPLQITSEGGPADTVTGDLCAAANTLPTYGGTSSPQAEIIYSFVAQGASGTIDIAAEGATWGANIPGVFLLPACSLGTDPIALGFPGSPMAVSGLTDGQTYYVVVTADPGSPDATCGGFTATVTGTLPVALQSFTVG